MTSLLQDILLQIIKMTNFSKHPMTSLSQDILEEILDENLSEAAWYSIVESMLIHCYLKDINKIFFKAISAGHLVLIKTFSELGVNAFTIAEGEKKDEQKPPIFGLAYLANANVTPKDVLKTIFNGSKKHYMRQLANSKKGDFNINRSLEENENRPQPKTLLEEAICVDNKKIIDYLIDFSNPKQVSGANGLTPLHWAVLKDDKPLIHKLLHKGLCPFEEAEFVPAHYERASMLWKYFNGNTAACKSALQGSDCFDLARKRIPSNIDFLNDEYDKLKHWLEDADENEELPPYTLETEEKNKLPAATNIGTLPKKHNVTFNEPKTDQEKEIHKYLNTLVEEKTEDEVE